MGTLVLVLAVIAVAGTGALAASCLELGSAISFLLAVYLFGSAEVVAISLLLSPGRRLTEVALLGFIGALAVAAASFWLALGRPRPPIARASAAAMRDALRDPIVALFAGLAVVSHTYLLAVSLTIAQSLPDTMIYHLPRSALWKQQHAVAYVPNVPKAAVNVFPPNAEIETAATMILSGGDRYVGLIQLMALVVACLGVLGIARRLGFDRRAAVFSALAFSTFTVVMLQAPTALNDLVVASFLVACVYFATGTERIELALASLAVALALGTKLTTVFALPALVLFVLASQPLRRWAIVALCGAAGIVAGSLWLVVNVVETGRLDGGVSVGPVGQSLAYRVLRSFADLVELSNVDGTRLLASPLWGTPVLLIAIVLTTVLCQRRQWARAAGVGLVGVFAFVSLPMLMTWMRLASYSLRQARVALGLGGTVPGERVPAGFYESAMHSSFGLAFTALFLGSVGLVATELVRRRSSFAPLAALIGVPLTLFIQATATGFDPQHLRYIVFPVALATSVFGIALRLRPLAWTSGALAAVTVVITIAYFVPRPAGLALLKPNREADRTARWFVQAGGGGGDPAAFRFMERSIPASSTLALDVEDNTYLYPAWDAGLRRRVLFTTPDGQIPAQAGWLVVGPGKRLSSAPEGWTRVFASQGGWRFYRRD